jgi:hypothetical protein
MASSATLQPRIAPRREPRPARDTETLSPTEQQILAKYRRLAALREKHTGLWIDLAIDLDDKGEATVNGAAGDGRRKR